MTANDFELQPLGPYQFHFWHARQRVQTPFGAFVVEARTDDTSPPDAAMIQQASKLADFTRTHPDAILDKIYEHYETVSEDPEWLEICEVPAALSREKLAPYLEGLSLVVERGEAEPTIYVIPRWDEEHAIYLAVRNGRVEFQEL